MGWLKGNSKQTAACDDKLENVLSRITLKETESRSQKVTKDAADTELSSEHIENTLDFRDTTRSTAEITNESPTSKSLEHLPFIDAEEIQKSADSQQPGSSKSLLLVIDQIVYNCTDFVDEHPGGDIVMRSFAGKDCSWQFWRFHNSRIMEDWGGPLRIGRTKGVENPYEERPRFVGLRKFGNDFGYE